MFIKLKIVAAAAVLAILPMVASATPMLFNEGGSTLIELDNTYSYSKTQLTGAGSLSFELTATPPSQIALETRFSVLEFTGNFANLVIELTTGEGSENAAFVGSVAQISEYSLSTIFNASRTFTQNLYISWDDVTAGPSAQAGILIQGTPSPVPAPAAGLLLLGALGGVGALRRRKKA
ncbi:MAG: VPLPA-CTERM sorting domain-containing protein [Sulfitobacter sp.]